MTMQSNLYDPPDSTVVVDYSTDDGLTWTLLRTMRYETLEPRKIMIMLPILARTRATVFRWWQVDNDKPRTLMDKLLSFHFVAR